MDEKKDTIERAMALLERAKDQAWERYERTDAEDDHVLFTNIDMAYDMLNTVLPVEG